MVDRRAMALDPAAMSAFAATLSTLPEEEIGKAKRLYVLNAITDYEDAKRSGKSFLIVMGVLCIIPLFLIVFIPALIGYRSGMKASRQKILNAIEVWKDDLGPDYEDIRDRVDGG